MFAWRFAWATAGRPCVVYTSMRIVVSGNVCTIDELLAVIRRAMIDWDARGGKDG